MRKTTELLAPAGNAETAYAAFNAGADAVYLGLDRYSARAYAGNLNIDELLKCLDYAHLHNRRIYLTLNTLLKNTEFSDACNMLEPLVSYGLDGIIVQDFGLLEEVNRRYPKLPMHASTQMSIMSAAAIELLRNYNVTRIVPARELSLDEIAMIKNTGIEVECFIHGAMCYGYSGKCLMSSIAGGRSGNRGRCAGTCRKAYEVYEGKRKLADECYPISMKDMCTLKDIEKMLRLNVDSFKIEGRMKSPEYSAGVTEIYRKYIDMYYEKGSVKVDPADMDKLRLLYIRKDICSGYLNKHNGKEMITLSSPSYNGIDKAYKDELTGKYVGCLKRLPVDIDVTIYNGCDTVVNISDGRYDTCYIGQMPEKAINKSLNEADIRKQFGKLGQTFYELNNINVNTDNESFLPVSVLNEMRRNAFEMHMLNYRKHNSPEYEDKVICNNEIVNESHSGLIIGVKNIKQYLALQNYDCDGLICDLFDDDTIKAAGTKPLYIRLPEIIRQANLALIRDALNKVKSEANIAGVYVPGVDALAIASECFEPHRIYLDRGFYVFNNEAEAFALKHAAGYTADEELNCKEMNHFNYSDKRELIIYSYIPLMYSANCLVKNFIKCDKSYEKLITLRDDANREFKALCNHKLCYNTMYNCAVLKLFYDKNAMNADVNRTRRIEFTIEDSDEVCRVMDEYVKITSGGNINGDTNIYTTGHYKRGVE